MPYLLGGASRAGKSRLAQRLLEERSIPYLPLDVLMMGLARGMPSFGVGPQLPASEVGERVWPVVRGMAFTALEDGVDYLFEGDSLLPRHAAELKGSHGEKVKAAFLGYANAPLGEKLRQVRAFGGGPDDWVAGLSDDRALGTVAENARFGARLREECAALDLAYFDTSRDFSGALDAAFCCLVGS